jgi:hypothetical protein
MGYRKIFCLIFYLSLLSIGLKAQSEISVSFNLGGAINLPTPLVIKQKGFEDIRLKANYTTESFHFPLYWDFSVAYCKNNYLWDIELIHHKLYLKNLPPEIERFSISHGLNLLNVNRGFKITDFYLKPGLGLAIGHPESTIRSFAFSEDGGLFDSGYYLSGASVNFSVLLLKSMFWRILYNGEIRLTYTFASVPVYQGRANVQNIAIHLTFGLGYKIITRHKG